MAVLQNHVSEQVSVFNGCSSWTSYHDDLNARSFQRTCLNSHPVSSRDRVSERNLSVCTPART